MTVNQFRQLLSVVPDFYTHSWITSKGSSKAVLAVDFERDVKKMEMTQIKFMT